MHLCSRDRITHGWTLNNLEEDQMLPLDQRPINQLPKPGEWRGSWDWRTYREVHLRSDP